MISLFHFAEASLPTQPNLNLSFGANPASPTNKFRLTSSFTLTAPSKAFAVFKGTFLLQQQTGNANKVNVVLKPIEPQDFKLPVKYVIYRGLDILSFLNANDLTAATTKVKTSGSELLVAMQLTQAQRNPGVTPVPDIPLQALFGDNLAPATTKKLEEFFFSQQTGTSQLFTVDGGMELGSFAAGDAGIEVMLENPDFFPTVEMAKKAFYEVDVTAITDPAQKKKKREDIRHFIDPAAFYGLNSNIPGGMEYRDATGARQPADTAPKVYDNIVKKFATKNLVYLDIRSENGYSLNFYGNYLGTGSVPADNAKQMKIGLSATTLALAQYYKNEWPLYVIDTIVPDATAAQNKFYLALRVKDNKRPLLAGRSVVLSPARVVDPPLTDTSSHKRVYFADETNLLSTPIPNTLPDFTNTIDISVTNVPGTTPAQMATLVRLDYIKQLLPLSPSSVFPKESLTDYLFGPVDAVIPWDTENTVKWYRSNHTTYVDALNDGYVLGTYTTTILSIDQTTKEIEIFDEVPVYRNNKVRIDNSGSNTNVGQYNIDENGVIIGGGTTKIKVKEAIPGVLQSGDKLTLTVKFDGQFDFTANTFVIGENKDFSLFEVLAAGNELNFYSHYSFSTSYKINTATYTTPRTTISFQTPKVITGFAGFAETGTLVESDNTATPPASDESRVVYYAAPVNYFASDGITKDVGFNSSGGAFNKSLFSGLEAMMPNVKVETIKLKISTSISFNTFKYTADSKAVKPLFLLGLSKTELDTAKTAAGALLTDNTHIPLWRLKGGGVSKTDLSNKGYHEYALFIATMNNAGVYTEMDTLIKVYTLDHLIFSSVDFGDKYNIDTSIANQALVNFLNDTLDGEGSDFSEFPSTNYSPEETAQLKKGGLWTLPIGVVTKTNKQLLNIEPAPTPTTDPSFKNIIRGLKTDLDTVTENKDAIITLLRTKGAGLMLHAKKKIREKNTAGDFLTHANRDGILYLSRLICQVVIKNHPILMSKFPSDINEFSNVFERASRGLDPLADSYPDFTKYFDDTFTVQSVPATAKKILVSGYDPFGAGGDANGYNSNPSGNIALSLDGTVIKDSSSNIIAVIRAVTFPVRYKEFNDRWIETFFMPFINPGATGYTSVQMVITFSYGGAKYFNLDRFASRYRSPYNTDNNGTYGDVNDYLNSADKNDLEFIESTLPFNDMYVPNRVVLHQKTAFGYVGGTAPIDPYGFNNFNSTPLVPYPSILNYPPPSGTASKIVAREGSGGHYLSNEIFYRVAFLRHIYNPLLKSGHIHVGFLNTGMSMSTDREIMLSTITTSITQAVLAFPASTSPLEGFIPILTGQTPLFTGLDVSTEETRNLSLFWSTYGSGLSNSELFFLDDTMSQKCIAFYHHLTQGVPGDIENIIKKTGEELLRDAKLRIRGINPLDGSENASALYVNKDGILYIARLIMQVILKNHPKITASPTTVTTKSDWLEKYSRGLEGAQKPTFPASHFKILISGYDPFGSAFPNSYYDGEGYQSNPSGNLALALDGKEITSGSKKAMIKSAILPVRFREFDEGWMEDFFGPYVSDTTIKMIITFSYGIDGSVYSFEIEKFAARHRGLGTPDNNQIGASASSYLNNTNKDNYEFIITKLPFNDMFILDNVGLDQKAVFKYYDGSTDQGISYINNSSTPTIDRTTNPFSGSNPHNDDLKASYAPNVPFPNITNYPPPSTITADKIKSDQGSGGDYLSNEIYYRVAYLRESSTNAAVRAKFTGHIHVGFLQGDPIESRTDMISIISAAIQQALANF